MSSDNKDVGMGMLAAHAIEIEETNSIPRVPKYINRATKCGCWVSIFYAAITTIFVIVGIMSKGFTWRFLPHETIVILLTYGGYKRSRACVILLLIYFLVNQAMMLQSVPFYNCYAINISLIALVFLFSYGIAGTIAFHQWKKRKNTTVKQLKVTTALCVLLSFSFYCGTFITCEFLAKKVAQNTLIEFDKYIARNKSENRYPVKINNDVTLRDVYRDDSKITYEYVMNINKESFTRVKLYSYGLSAFKRVCALPIFSATDIKAEYLFILDTERISMVYDKRDCR
ncbi:hypothetical protein CD201_13305 [Hafnia alvei]|uniref:hypothetical protein n=1 Tax=Hafnia alvei TaxID=569 RepID=UPI000DAAEA3D|nr:hypothetical protein [Hafnia alvei]AWV45479.1 hypothetical protein CD201_13305 [Hafnia alvei]